MVMQHATHALKGEPNRDAPALVQRASRFATPFRDL